jgi:hypothetical protein
MRTTYRTSGERKQLETAVVYNTATQSNGDRRSSGYIYIYIWQYRRQQWRQQQCRCARGLAEAVRRGVWLCLVGLRANCHLLCFSPSTKRVNLTGHVPPAMWLAFPRVGLSAPWVLSLSLPYFLYPFPLRSPRVAYSAHRAVYLAQACAHLLGGVQGTSTPDPDPAWLMWLCSPHLIDTPPAPITGSAHAAAPSIATCIRDVW